MNENNNENKKNKENEEFIFRPIILKDLKLDENKLYVLKSGPINKIALSTLKKYKFFPLYQLKNKEPNNLNKENNSVNNENNEKENSNDNNNNNNNKSESESISSDHNEFLGKKRKKIKNNNNLENNLNNNLNNNIENNIENNNNNEINKPSEYLTCLTCNWKFPSKMTLNEINNHINECLDGKGEKNRLEYEKTYKLLDQTK